MEFMKFKLTGLILLFSFCLHAQERFSSKECLDANFTMKMIYKGTLFGLIKHELSIDKEGCLINLTQKKYYPKKWSIDVCREPVHIKMISSTGIEVSKKIGNCFDKKQSSETESYCSDLKNLTDVIQDDGLIFASGDRDDITTDHGKTFCSYLLIKKYLEQGVVFSRYAVVSDIFSSDKEVPTKNESKDVDLSETKIESIDEEIKIKPELDPQ